MSVTDELIANNAAYAEEFAGPLPLPPAKHVAVVACMDARLNVYGALGLHEGEAHVIRNAGGVITQDEIRSLAISQRLLGTREIILIHHTDCGMLTFTDDGFKQGILDEVGIKPPWAAEAFDDVDDRRAAVDRPHRGQPVHPEEGLGARLRLRRRHRQAERGRLEQRRCPAQPVTPPGRIGLPVRLDPRRVGDRRTRRHRQVARHRQRRRRDQVAVEQGHGAQPAGEVQLGQRCGQRQLGGEPDAGLQRRGHHARQPGCLGDRAAPAARRPAACT